MLYKDAKIKARPTKFISKKICLGIQEIGIGRKNRDGLIYIPENAHGSLPLVILLHGARGKASQMLLPFKEIADKMGTVLLIPESRRDSWDFLRAGYGPDVEFIDKSLEKLFSCVSIDQTRIAIAGFSDGASYALSLGITNGDLFTYIMAFSPGFMAPKLKEDSPKIFISHGRVDRVLNIDNCSRTLVPALKNAGLNVTYREFKGGHFLPTEIIKEAFNLFIHTGDHPLRSHP